MRNTDTPERETANERFKRGFSSWLWGALILATGAHFILFRTAPPFSIQDVSYRSVDVEVVDIPDEIEIPTPPASIPRPATPVIAEAMLETEVTIAPTTFEANPVEHLPPPPPRNAAGEANLSAAPTFTPMTVRPRLLNAPEIARVLVEQYPRLLRDAGIGGTVMVWFFIDETGRVVRTLIHESSGWDELDQAALTVADRMEFSPAFNRDQRVPVWVSVPVTFEVIRR